MKCYIYCVQCCHHHQWVVNASNAILAAEPVKMSGTGWHAHARAISRRRTPSYNSLDAANLPSSNSSPLFDHHHDHDDDDSSAKSGPSSPPLHSSLTPPPQQAFPHVFISPGFSRFSTSHGLKARSSSPCKECWANVLPLLLLLLLSPLLFMLTEKLDREIQSGIHSHSHSAMRNASLKVPSANYKVNAMFF